METEGNRITFKKRTHSRVGAELPNTPESHRVPSGHWKIIGVQDSANLNSLYVAAFLFPQEAPRDARVMEHFTTVDAVEARTGLDFLHELPDAVEKKAEKGKLKSWAKHYFDK